MLLDEEEATTLAIALRAASATVAGIDDTARGLLSKLDPLVPTRRRQQAGEVHAATATLSDLPSTDARLLGTAGHCRQASRLAFEYRSAQEAVTQREVEAQHLVNYGRRWYLLAWDLGRQDWRTLRVDRMGAVRECTEPGMHRRTPAPPDVMVRQAVSQARSRCRPSSAWPAAAPSWKAASRRGVVCWRPMARPLPAAHGRREPRHDAGADPQPGPGAGGAVDHAAGPARRTGAAPGRAGAGAGCAAGHRLSRVAWQAPAKLGHSPP
jgi:hypothetical protein